MGVRVPPIARLERLPQEALHDLPDGLRREGLLDPLVPDLVEERSRGGRERATGGEHEARLDQAFIDPLVDAAQAIPMASLRVRPLLA